MIQSLFRIVVVTLLLLLSGGARADTPTTGTLRIVTLSPNLTEEVFALGFGDQVVAVTDFCQWPEAATQKPRVGGLYNLNMEKLLSLRPTVVFHSADHRGAIDRLGKFGIRTVLVPTESMDDIYSGIDKIGAELGATDRAKALNARIKSQLDDLTRLYGNKRKVKVLYVVDNSPGEMRQIYVLGPGTFLDDVLTRAGCINVMADSKAYYPLLSREYIIAHPPELIIAGKQEDTPEGRAAWHEFLGGSKVQFLFIDDRHLAIPGPSIGERASDLAARIDKVRSQLD